ASLRNILSTGARILAYSPDYYTGTDDPARLIWENDRKLSSNGEKKDPSIKDITLWVKSGGGVDKNAHKAIEDLLSKGYIGIAVETSKRNREGTPLSSGIVF